MSDRIRPFYCGSQWADFQCSNCDRCTKDYDVKDESYRCDLQQLIDEAALGDGTVSIETARRMGIVDATRGHFLWPCAEVDWTPEWKAEWQRRQTLRYRIGKALLDVRRRIRKEISDRWRRLRQCVLWPIAERRGMRDPDGCWSAWCGWAMGYGERPGPNSGESCKVSEGECGSCWCGKFHREAHTDA